MVQPLTTERPSYLRLLRDRSFGALWVAQMISESGDAVFNVALLWLVLVTTGSTVLVGVTEAVVLLPGVLAAPAAGVYADRLNRRNLMIVSNIVQGIITAGIAVLNLTGFLNFSLLILLVLSLYTGAQFFRAAISTLIPKIVGKENLGAANGLFYLSTCANQLVSYSFGGLVIVAVGATFSVTYDSLTFIVAAGLLTLIAKSYGQIRNDGITQTQERRESDFWREFREGLVYLWKSRVFLELMAFGLLADFFGEGIFAIFAPYVKLWLHGNALAYGFLLSSFALGTAIGSFAIGKVNFREYVGKLLFVGVFGIGFLVVALGFIATVPSAIAVCLLLGAVLAVVMLPMEVLVQTQIPGEVLGRAVTVMGSVLGLAEPIAAVSFGWLVGVAPIGSVFSGAGLALIAVTTALYVGFSELRRAKY